jgi:hypothetical protein
MLIDDGINGFSKNLGLIGLFQFFFFHCWVCMLRSMLDASYQISDQLAVVGSVQFYAPQKPKEERREPYSNMFIIYITSRYSHFNILFSKLCQRQYELLPSLGVRRL